MDSDSDTVSTNLSYFGLMEKVGTNGPYQWAIFCLSMVYWIICGICVVNASFVFLIPQFDCTSFSVSQSQCEKFICDHCPDTVMDY